MLIGLMTYGGGYSALPLVEDLILRQRGCLSASEVADIVSISEMSPGPFSLNCSSFVGMKVAGVPGALMATTGFLLPPLVIVLALALLYRRIRSASAAGKVFAVLNACIIAVLLASAVNLFSSSVLGGLQAGGKIDILALVLFLASFLALFRWKVNPVLLQLASSVIGAVILPLIRG